MANLAEKKVLREVTIPEQVQLWRWVSETIIGVVGKQNVYHIDITTVPSTASPTKVFEL